MNSKQIKGIAVVSIADGTKLGTVDQVYVDPADRRVVGFTLHSGGGLLSRHSHDGLIDVADIHALGSDALTLDDASKVQEDAPQLRDAGLITIDDLVKRKVVTENGTFVGQIAAVEFDETAFRLAEIEVSPGFFKSNKHVAADHVISLGGDVVIVADAVVSGHDATAAAGNDRPSLAETPGDE